MSIDLARSKENARLSGSKHSVAASGNYILRGTDDEEGDLGAIIVIDHSEDVTSPVSSDPSTIPEELGLRSEGVDQRSLLSVNNKSISGSLGTREFAWWRHPRVRKNPKTIGAALGLFLVGIGFLIGSIFEFLGQSMTPAVIFLIGALITGLPGAYMSFYIFNALRGKPGYHFSGIPSFDA